MASRRILWVDDQLYYMQDWIEVLQAEGFEVIGCNTPDESARYYNYDNYDVIILDRMMPSEIDGTIYERTGIRVHHDIRQRQHLKTVPIIFFTNYYNLQEEEEIIEFDLCAIVRTKDKLPIELLQIVRDMIARFPVQRESPQILDDEDPNIAPYYAWEVSTNARIRLYFKRCSPNEAGVIFDAESLPLWRYGSDYMMHLSDPITSRFVLQALPHNNAHIRLAGLYYTGGYRMPEQWSEKVQFEVAPWNRPECPTRQLRGVEKVMVARFLREYLYRNAKLEDDVIFNLVRFDEDDNLMPTDENGKSYLLSLGFEEVPGEPYLLQMGHEAARRLLIEVSQPVSEE